ncbi:thiamine pyrophosphate-dependent enzyme [Corynebacterium lipophiloflavum]|uniref:acetolactate synthase n=1 Tax=Corynebacterium lipophiloflavum (strain ATCC 700352 / DSM 44291 / CCUG 37336 / JCM 10383 / DMMZ 1944) TaxID=525263 RepID=C0XQ50_CORLD|nr:thiamine pyrophosphate-dependent enzyme [Corynebacterium lipophiloflavum]EEI17643.1 thiamine pyrophosphate enzyme, C-terminal TPP binding domain protein [Corynebacterium lipophiloflavum DSM 44291]
MHVGAAIAQSLESHHVSHVFMVPGESFLAVLDGLHDSPVTSVVCRHEGGATYAAEAHGKATGRAGVAMVTRGPGAANAKIGVYTAWQDEVPVVLFVGLVPVKDRYRESFQEFDINSWFGDIAKGVFVIDDAQRASRVVANAFHLAQSGRRGPVVVGLPEDVLLEEFTGEIAGPMSTAQGAVSDHDIEIITEALRGARTPLIFEGGQGWTQQACDAVQSFAERHSIPVVNDMRSTDRISFDSPANAGWLGTARNDETAQLLEEADVLLCIGAKLWDKPTDNFTLRQSLDAVNIVVNSDAGLKGASGALTHHVLADPHAFAQVIGEISLDSKPDTTQWFAKARNIHAEFSAIPDPEERFANLPEGAVDFYHVFEQVTARLDETALTAFGAGNHCFWPQRFFPTRRFPSMLAPRLGSMGYSVAAGLAAKLAHPEKTVVVFAGDGELLMNGQEIVTAVRYGAPMLIVVVDNQQYGTIRAHQEKHFPGRVEGTQLANPDFAAWARAMGAWAETITTDDEVEAAVEHAFAALDDAHVAVLHVIVDQDHATPEGSAQA